ncbi:hypothetical protein SDC9_183779 [bioreactor metagenome]|uniref:Uncharacterized protein n=1 Tax=bioreactor metagenome TaxID=1076179 RepID=A0A645HC28_9ZZZZ
MAADGADLGRFAGHGDVAAVAALPAHGSLAREGVAVLQGFKYFLVAFFVGFFNAGYGLEFLRQLVKAFRAGLAGHAGIHIGPFAVLASSCMLKIGGNVSKLFQFLEPEFGVLLFLVGGLGEDFGHLFIAGFFSRAGKISILVARHGFARKSFP